MGEFRVTAVEECFKTLCNAFCHCKTLIGLWSHQTTTWVDPSKYKQVPSLAVTITDKNLWLDKNNQFTRNPGRKINCEKKISNFVLELINNSHYPASKVKSTELISVCTAELRMEYIVFSRCTRDCQSLSISTTTVTNLVVRTLHSTNFFFFSNGLPTDSKWYNIKQINVCFCTTRYDELFTQTFQKVAAVDARLIQEDS